MGILGVAIGAYVRSAFFDVALFDRVRGFALTLVSSAAGFCTAWSAASISSRSQVDAYLQSLPPGYWLDWGRVVDCVRVGDTAWWLMIAAGVSAVVLHGLDLAAAARTSVKNGRYRSALSFQTCTESVKMVDSRCQGQTRSWFSLDRLPIDQWNLERARRIDSAFSLLKSLMSRLRLGDFSRINVLAVACGVFSACAGWIFGVFRAHEAVSETMRTSLTASWVDSSRISIDILYSGTPWWMMVAILLAALALLILGRVADTGRKASIGSDSDRRIIIPATYRSRQP
ncbi:hypothetical protein C7S18_08180 [Ahniella affigens]|uniref:Uncharacterized protein n=2 Tax=Ahniella affigens TaxID=2021234 RepID=A0A2P1PQR6_9GAMM|nr:hypothetical protein C7S18_08180 [Ahniella affigens]